MRWEKNREEEEENWASWRKDQSEGEMERRDTRSLVCDMVPPSVVSGSSQGLLVACVLVPCVLD